MLDIERLGKIITRTASCLISETLGWSDLYTHRILNIVLHGALVQMVGVLGVRILSSLLASIHTIQTHWYGTRYDVCFGYATINGEPSSHLCQHRCERGESSAFVGIGSVGMGTRCRFERGGFGFGPFNGVVEL